MICKNCNTNIPDNLNACPKCGASTHVNVQLFCHHCGAELNQVDDFCTSCGKYTEKKKNEIETKKATAGAMVILGFIFPILGFIYAALKRKSDETTASTIFVASIFGFAIEVFVFLPSLIYFL